jgi:hypothetical protein
VAAAPRPYSTLRPLGGLAEESAMSAEVLKSLARLMQQTAVKQAVQECALRRLLALLPADQASAMAAHLQADVAQVMESFSAGIDQPMVDATIANELNAMLQALDAGRGPGE